MTDEKVYTICKLMHQHKIDVLCLQETWATKAEYYSHDGFRVILSGAESAGRCWARVGFVVSPWCCHRLRGFLQFSDRLASVKIQTSHGKIALINAYAPHNLKPHDERWQFYIDLGVLHGKISTNGPKYVLGDFNARLGGSRPGEEDIIGPFTFGREARHAVETPNRDLLMEFCHDRGYIVANTMAYAPAEQKVTFMEAGAVPLSQPTGDNFAILDLVLVPSEARADVAMLSSMRTACLASDHFLVYCKLRCEYAGQAREKKPSRKDLTSFCKPTIRQEFVRAFADQNQYSELGHGDVVEEAWSSIAASFSMAASVVPEAAVVPRQPWISQATLALIGQRAAARATGNHALEQRLHRLVRKSAKTDKGAWLDETVASGSWESIRRLKKPRGKKQGRLMDQAGDLVSSEDRADTMAEYLEQVQWRVRPAEVTDMPLLRPPLPVSLSNFNLDDIRSVLTKLC